jgi:hypothetical protein
MLAFNIADLVHNLNSQGNVTLIKYINALRKPNTLQNKLTDNSFR